MSIKRLVNSKNLSILIVMFIVTLSCAYASFNSVLNITGTVADVRIKSDIRITGLRVNGVTSGGTSLSEDYNKASIKVGTLLPNSASTVSYAVDITNTGNQEMKLASITGLPDNLEYVLTDYNIGDKLCQNDKCSLGLTKTIILTLKYKDGSFSSTFTTHNLNLNFEFKRFTNSYLRSASQESYSTSPFLNTDITKSQIESVTFKSSDEIPDSAITFSDKKYFDVSHDQSDSIKLYAEDVDSNGLYEIYIGQDGGVKANSGSQYLFLNLNNVYKIDLQKLNTDGVTSMSEMFRYCSKIVTLDLSNFNTSDVTTMAFMFAYCQKINSLDLTNFDTTGVKNMRSMFDHCTSLTYLNLSSFNTQNVTDMGVMFQWCSSLTTLDLSSFNTLLVTDMSYMFFTCSKLVNLDLTMFNTEKVTNMSYMFTSCGSLKTIDLRGEYFTVDAARNNLTDMYKGCSSLEAVYLRDINERAIYRLNYPDYESIPFNNVA